MADHDDDNTASLDLFLEMKRKKEKKVSVEERLPEETRQLLAKDLMKAEKDAENSCVRSKRAIYAQVLANVQHKQELAKAAPPPPPVEVKVTPIPNPHIPSSYKIPKIPRAAVEVTKLDEWGDPIKPGGAATAGTPELDEWGDPVMPKGQGSAPKPKLDEWGQEEPVMSYGQHKKMTGVGRAPSFQRDQGQQRQVKKPQPNQEVDEWGDPIKPSAPIITRLVTVPAAAKQELDEWGEPVKTSNNAPSEIVASSTTLVAIPAQELDEWGKPIKPPTGNKVNEVSSAPELDEWGDPIKPASIGAKSCSITAVTPAAAQEVDEWGDPIKPAGAQQVPATDDWGSISTTTPAADDWGSSSSASSDNWGSNGGSSRSSFDGNSRGRGRGRGDRGGRGRGGGRGGREAREPREGDWTCKECNAYNYSGRTECFRCKVAKAGGDNDSFSNGGRPRGGGARRGGRNGGDNPNYEPVTKKVRTDFDEWGPTPAPKKANLDDWGSTASICGTVTPVDDDWGNSAMKRGKPAHDDWGSKLTPPSTIMDNWGPAPIANNGATLSISTTPLVSRNGGGQKRNFNPASDWTDAGNGSQSMADKKSMSEWTCPDTRCGNLNFEWRQDCFRCGAVKTNSVVIQDNNRSTSSLRSPPEIVSRQPREYPRVPSLYPSLDRIKAPPDEKNLKRTLSIGSSFLGEAVAGVNVTTETPAEWSYGGRGLSNLIVDHDQGLLPLTHRFEAISQNPGGGPACSPSKALIKASPAVVQAPPALQTTRSITQIPEVTITAPRTRNRVNAKWVSLQITVTDLPDKKTEAEKNEPISEENVEPKSEEINENQMELEEKAPSKDEQNLVLSTEPVIAGQTLTLDDVAKPDEITANLTI